MILKIVSIGLAIILYGCTNQGTQTESVPSIFQVEWREMNVDTLPVKFGQQLEFGNGKDVIQAIVLDFDYDEGGNWIGLCLLNDNRLFGRQIPSGLSEDCIDLLDLEYLHLSGFHDYHILENLPIDSTKIGVGSSSAIRNFNDLKRNFDLGIEKRKVPPTPCQHKGYFNLDPHNECYFETEKIIIRNN